MEKRNFHYFSLLRDFHSNECKEFYLYLKVGLAKTHFFKTANKKRENDERQDWISP